MKDAEVQPFLRDSLLDDDVYSKLLQFFMDKTIEESRQADDEPKFVKWYALVLNTLIKSNSSLIDAFQESPIEKLFLRSLLLGFVKADPFGLVIHQFGLDAENEVRTYRSYHREFKEFIGWWEKQNKPWTDIERYLDSERDKGRMSTEERDYLRHLTFRYYYLQLSDSIHLTLQPRFPKIRIHGRGIRPDLFFWSAVAEEFGLIVECDGFAHHSSKASFETDRRRDRSLLLKGFRTLRFSGTEIYKAPATATSEILQLLWQEKERCMDRNT